MYNCHKDFLGYVCRIHGFSFFFKEGRNALCTVKGTPCPSGLWDSAVFAALPTKTPSLSLGRESPPRNRRWALLQDGGHLEAVSASPPCFFFFVSGLDRPVLLPMAAFLSLPIRGCLPKSRTTHSPRDVVIPRLILSCGTGVAPRLPSAGTRNMPLHAAPSAAPASVWPPAVHRHVPKAKAIIATVSFRLPADPAADPPDLNMGHF